MRKLGIAVWMLSVVWLCAYHLGVDDKLVAFVVTRATALVGAGGGI